MGHIAQLIAKIAFASTVSVFLCVNAGMYSYAAHIGAEGRTSDYALQHPSEIDSMNLPADMQQTDEHDASTDEGNVNSNRNVAPDGMPAAIGQSDGTVYTYQEEIVNEDGENSYVYSTGEDVNFDDGGLGDAELIIN